jgi:hypothetical protein
MLLFKRYFIDNQGLDDGGSKHLLNVSKLDYMAQHPRRQSSVYCSP